jgi:hypothetical protein
MSQSQTITLSEKLYASVRSSLEYLEAKRATFRDQDPEVETPEDLEWFMNLYNEGALVAEDPDWDYGPNLGTAVGFVDGVAAGLGVSRKKLFVAAGYDCEAHSCDPPLPENNNDLWA